MSENINISAAIVTYNNGDKAAAAAASVLARCEKYPLDFYIIDNNSSDDTLSRLKDLKPLKIVRLPKNIGFGAAHNKIIEKVDSDYHFIVNPDITVSDDVFANIVDYMEAHPDVAMCAPDILNTDGTRQYLPKSKPTFRRLFLGRLSKKVRSEYVWRDREITAPCDVDFCSGCFLCVRTSVFKKLGGFDERYFMYLEDADLTLRVKSLGRTVFLPDIKVTHIWERGSHKNIKLLLLHTASCVKFLRKWRNTTV